MFCGALQSGRSCGTVPSSRTENWTFPVRGEIFLIQVHILVQKSEKGPRSAVGVYLLRGKRGHRRGPQGDSAPSIGDHEVRASCLDRRGCPERSREREDENIYIQSCTATRAVTKPRYHGRERHPGPEDDWLGSGTSIPKLLHRATLAHPAPHAATDPWNHGRGLPWTRGR